MIFQTHSRVNAEDIQVDKLLDEIESYWSTRTDGYSEVNEKELKGMQKAAWLGTLERGFWGENTGKELTSEKKKQLRILDIGTGPGFFPMILAEAGYHVTAVDYTPGMLEKAGENAAKFIGEKKNQITFKRMDAQALEFEDESFDVIISRNLTWTLPHVRHAYGEWIRVLKKDGVLLNFDANYGITDFSNVEDLPENHAHNMLGDDMMRECEELKRQLPISSYSRPAWDLETLGAMELKEFRVDLGVSSRIYLEKDAFYNPTPLFMLRTIK